MPPTYLSFDDTDSLDGMCTTYLATLMIENLRDFDLIGFPRLVRLNPNVPWKTRGNAAISLAFGYGNGKRFLVGEIDGEGVYAYSSGKSIDSNRIFRTAHRIIKKNAHLDCGNTNPGIVVSDKRPPSSLYWSAVREILSLENVECDIVKIGAQIGKFKNGRGIIGASAAMAWIPRDRTYEVLTYRNTSRIGTRRYVDPRSVKKMDMSIQSTFHNIDLKTGHIAITPGSPCPILFGIRGDDPWDLLTAKDMVRSEPVDRWLLFLTNQGTDDHILRRRICNIEPRQGARLTGVVSSEVRQIAGGHVFFEIKDSTGTITCAVYEPSGSMRSAARELKTGDRIEVFGSVRETPFEINIEKMRVIRINSEGDKIENPICPKCGKHMKSIGLRAGFRCRKCGDKAPLSAAKKDERKKPSLGWYEPPIASRRHLYKPVSRIGIKRTPLREILYSYPLD